MMRVLLVEDQEHFASMLVDKLTSLDGVVVTECANRESALREIRRQGFDLALVDLNLSRHSRREANILEGIDVSTALRESSEHVAIVVYSEAIKPGDVEHFAYYDQCMESADIVLSRQELFALPPRQLELLLNEVLAERGQRALSAREFVKADDLRTRAAVHRVGCRNLKELIRQLIPDGRSDRVEAIGEGHSGALLFRVKTQPSREGEDVLSNLLKVAHQSHALDRELARKPPAGTTLSEHAVVPHTSISRNYGDWWGVAIREVRDAVPLSTFLAETTLADGEEMLTRVVEELVEAPASRAASSSGAPASAADVLAPSLPAAYETASSLRRLHAIRRVTSSRDRSKIESLVSFVEQLASQELNLTRNSAGQARLHGDLHCGNILVAERTEPTLIDFPRSIVYPRLLDYACLNVDIVMTQLGRPDGSEWDWSLVPYWTRWAQCVFPFHRNRCEGQEGAATPLRRLRDLLLLSLNSQLPDVSAAEYAESLVFNLLRYIRFETVSAPKKIVAVRMAEVLIRKYELG